MPKKYFKLGTIKKKAGFQLYEYLFNYGLLWDGTTDVFVLKKPRKNKVASQSGIEADAESRDDLEEQFSPHEWIPGGIDK